MSRRGDATGRAPHRCPGLGTPRLLSPGSKYRTSVPSLAGGTGEIPQEHHTKEAMHFFPKRGATHQPAIGTEELPRATSSPSGNRGKNKKHPRPLFRLQPTLKMTANRFRAVVSDVRCCSQAARACYCQPNAISNKAAHAGAPKSSSLHRVRSLHPVP